MSSIFAQRRARLLAMKTLRERYVPAGNAATCPKCGQDSESKAVKQAMSVCPLCGHHFPIGAYYRLSITLDHDSFRELFPRMTAQDLVPQVADAVSVPVIAAGGIADGRQLAAAFALGACGVQVGTCLLVSEECPIHDNYKQALLKARDSDTTVTGRSIGGPVRVLKNKMAREYLALEKRGASLEELEKVTLGGLRRAVLEGDMDTGSVMCGQVAGMLREVRPVKDILHGLWDQGQAVWRSLE